MRNYIKEELVKIKPSGIRKYFDVARTMPNVISLGVGEPDFNTPEHIKNAGIEAINNNCTHYTSNQGLLELREEICIWNKRHHNLEYDPSEVIVTIGGSEGVDNALRSIIEQGDEVITHDPGYVSYVPGIIMAGGVPVIVKLDQNNNFTLNSEALEKAITPKTKAVLINYPNNPTGAIISYDDMMKIRDVIIKHDLILISDEVYSSLVYEEDFVSFASLPNMKERTIVVNAFSKTFSMTGWRIGYLLGPSNMINHMLKLHQFAIMSASTISQFAAIQALKFGDEDIKFMRNEYNTRRKFVLSAFRSMNIECFEAKGAFYVFPCIKRFKLTSDEFVNRLLASEHVVVVPGDAFGSNGEGYLRVSYAYSMEQLKEALSRIKRFVERLEKEL